MNEVLGINDGPPPEVNLKNEKNNGQIIMQLIDNNFVRSVHDVSAGGIILSLAEMSMMHSGIGAKIARPKNYPIFLNIFLGKIRVDILLKLKSKK